MVRGKVWLEVALAISWVSDRVGSGELIVQKQRKEHGECFKSRFFSCPAHSFSPYVNSAL